MIKVDISRVVPATAFKYLAALIPGLFFEVLLAVGNPERAVALSSSRSVLGIGYYTSGLLALLVGFIAGSGFMVVVALIGRILHFVYRVKTALWKWLIRRFILPAASRLIRERKWQGRRWLSVAYRYLHMKGAPFSTELMELQRGWHVVKSELLRRRYGIDPSRSRDMDPGVWYSVLGMPTAEDLGISVLVISMEAAGWCGIAAIHFAPNLNNRYFVGLLCLLIFGGLMHQWAVVKWQCNPVLQTIVKLRVALRDLRKETERSGIAARSENEHGPVSLEQDTD